MGKGGGGRQGSLLGVSATGSLMASSDSPPCWERPAGGDSTQEPLCHSALEEPRVYDGMCQLAVGQRSAVGSEPQRPPGMGMQCSTIDTRPQ